MSTNLELYDKLLKDRNLDSNTHAISFLNDNDSPVSNHTGTFQSAQREDGYYCLGEKQLQTVFPTTQY